MLFSANVMNSKPKTILILLLVLLLSEGCAGGGSRSVAIHQHGDAELSCAELAQALDQILVEISSRLLPASAPTAADTSGVTDIFLLQPARYRELNRPAQNEVNTLVERYNYLVGIGREKDCECTRQQLPRFE